MLLGREINIGFERGLSDVLADQDELAAHGEVADRAAVVARVGDGGRFDGELAQVGRHRHVADRLGVLEVGPERDGGCEPALGDQFAGDLVHLLMQRVEEVLALQEPRHALVGSVVDQDRAEQRLLRLEAVRWGSRKVDIVTHQEAPFVLSVMISRRRRMPSSCPYRASTRWPSALAACRRRAASTSLVLAEP